MFIALFATILCGALAFMLFQLRMSARHETVAKALQKLREEQAATLEKQKQKELKEQQERKERLDIALARCKEETETINKWKDARTALLESKLPRTFEEEEELAKYHADAEHEKAMATTGFTSLMIHQLFSPRIIEDHAPVADPSAPQPLPPKLIVWKTPSTRHMIENMKIHARAQIGTVIPWRQDHDNIRFHHITDYMMVRVNAPHRWIQLSMTYYKTDSCNETIAEYLKTLDETLFVETEKKSNPKGEWMMWDPVEKTLEIRIVQ
jgi:hypothetical protein